MQRGQEDEHEQPGRDGAEQDAQGPRAEDALEPRRQRPAGGAPLELRPLPERAEREEREDEHDGAAPEEEPVGDRQVPDAADPVREQASGTDLELGDLQAAVLELDLEPARHVGREAIVAGCPGATSAMRS